MTRGSPRAHISTGSGCVCVSHELRASLQNRVQIAHCFEHLARVQKVVGSTQKPSDLDLTRVIPLMYIYIIYTCTC